MLVPNQKLVVTVSAQRRVVNRVILVSELSGSMRGRDVAQVSRAGAVHDARHAGLNAARVRAPFAAALVALASGAALVSSASLLQANVLGMRQPPASALLTPIDKQTAQS